MSFFEPLRELTELEDISLCPNNADQDCISLRDGDVAQLASAWPKLTKLKLNADSLLGPGPHPTFASLYIVAMNWPRLTHLQLALDLTQLPPAPSVPVLSHGLKEIDIGKSSISDSKHLVRLMDRIFPCLISIESWGGDEEGVIRGELDDLRQLCQYATQHARIRWAGIN